MAGDFDKAREMTGKDDTAMSRLLGIGLALQGAVRRRDDVEKAMQESMMEIIPQLEKRTHYLATFANLATLLGLLGTVSGLIHAFSAVATANPAEKANLLSASISEAMNCTAFGLMIAVPLLFVHAFLQTKTSRADRRPRDGRGQVPECAHQARHCKSAGGAHRAGARGIRIDHARQAVPHRAAQPAEKAGGAAARADDRHLHGAGHVPADDGGVLAHHDHAARPAERRSGKSVTSPTSGSR